MDGPKMLVLDIENSPVLADVWALFKQNVGINQIWRDWFMLSWAAKWLGDEYVYSDALIHYDDYKKEPECDIHILRSLRDMLEDADIVIGHNSQRFDLPKIRARMVMSGIEPFSPVQQVDTLKIAKAQFNFTSNKLQFIAQALGIGEKMDTGGHLLWVDCIKGDKKAWALMEEYNQHDVVLTEQVYERLAPWSTSHPNWGLYVDEDRMCCTVCGSEDLRKKGFAYTTVGRYQRFKCNVCGKHMRSRKNVGHRKNLLTNVI